MRRMTRRRYDEGVHFITAGRKNGFGGGEDVREGRERGRKRSGGGIFDDDTVAGTPLTYLAPLSGNAEGGRITRRKDFAV